MGMEFDLSRYPDRHEYLLNLQPTEGYLVRWSQPTLQHGALALIYRGIRGAYTTSSLCVTFSGQWKDFTTACLAVGLTQVVAQSNDVRDSQSAAVWFAASPPAGSAGAPPEPPHSALTSCKALARSNNIRIQNTETHRALRTDRDSSSQPTRHYLGNDRVYILLRRVKVT
ncbi:predicted protein [Chaetomium globosum CBS 148.51]|uniref:Uncharacterized protein n=1 Tax=Chaetomium globosum (strain ATCC 6205 / CBS 148.51 / DSM 1962 / NBRC 6347 / NRRL 1970) TaxID=306901 RepID=Q2H1X1_CHAGB|nr:uncharacterized protein CHGG_04225 [Chaetomium globosum CBS 148.51]EAQ87606.1 predicted protein [Chaetomium globosum CBS 148.51]